MVWTPARLVQENPWTLFRKQRRQKQDPSNIPTVPGQRVLNRLETPPSQGPEAGVAICLGRQVSSFGASGLKPNVESRATQSDGRGQLQRTMPRRLPQHSEDHSENIKEQTASSRDLKLATASSRIQGNRACNAHQRYVDNVYIHE